MPMVPPAQRWFHSVPMVRDDMTQLCAMCVTLVEANSACVMSQRHMFVRMV